MYGDEDEYADGVCGSGKTMLFTRISRAVYVEFHSDSTINGKGFTAVYTMSDIDGQCGGILTNTTNSIVAPDRDGDGQYDNNLNCLWAIIAPRDHVIELEFRDLDLEETDTCDFDVIELFDADEFGIATPSIHRFCGDAVPSLYKNSNIFISSSNILYVQFFSDESVTGTRFKLIYRHIHVDSLRVSTTTMDKTVKIDNNTTTTTTETTSRKTTKLQTGGMSSKPNTKVSVLLAIVLIVLLV